MGGLASQIDEEHTKFLAEEDFAVSDIQTVASTVHSTHSSHNVIRPNALTSTATIKGSGPKITLPHLYLIYCLFHYNCTHVADAVINNFIHADFIRPPVVPLE